MFDIGFAEIFVIAIVALLVLGPERLPKAARFAGLWVRRARAQWHSVKSELENELADEELKRSLRQTQADLREAREALAQSGASLQQQFDDARTELQGTLRDTRETLETEDIPQRLESAEALDEPPPPADEHDEEVEDARDLTSTDATPTGTTSTHSGRTAQGQEHDASR